MHSAWQVINNLSLQCNRDLRVDCAECIPAESIANIPGRLQTWPFWVRGRPEWRELKVSRNNVREDLANCLKDSAEPNRVMVIPAAGRQGKEETRPHTSLGLK